MSRFDRNPSKKPSGDSMPAPSSSPSVSTSSNIDVQELQERLKDLQQRRMRREVELEHAKRELEECQRLAQQFGVRTLEELEAKVRSLAEEDAKEREEFVRALDQEEQLLNDIDRQMSELGKDQ